MNILNLVNYVIYIEEHPEGLHEADIQYVKDLNALLESSNTICLNQAIEDRVKVIHDIAVTYTKKSP